MLVLGLGMNCMKERRDCGTRYEYLDRTPKFGRLASLAGVVQWQNGSFPSCIRGFDSLRPLHIFRQSAFRVPTIEPDLFSSAVSVHHRSDRMPHLGCTDDLLLRPLDVTPEDTTDVIPN